MRILFSRVHTCEGKKKNKYLRTVSKTDTVRFFTVIFMLNEQLFYQLDTAALASDPQAAALYREYPGEKPACLKAARLLLSVCRRQGRVIIITGFVLAPFNKPETDGAIGSVLLSKALRVLGAGVTLVCPAKCFEPLRKMLCAIGADASVTAFDGDDSQRLAAELYDRLKPDAVVAAECPGATASGVYRNAAGEDVTALQAKCDLLFELSRKHNVPAIAVGDRGNECGMGSLKEAVRRVVPHGELIAARSCADAVLVGKTSEYACYALIASLSTLAHEPSAMFSQGEHIALFETARQAGLIDMGGRAITAVDGIAMEAVLAVSREMRELLLSAL